MERVSGYSMLEVLWTMFTAAAARASAALRAYAETRGHAAAAFRAFLERLSPASRYARFQYVVKDVTPQLLRPLLEADPRSHVALGAFDGERLEGEVLAGNKAMLAFVVRAGFQVHHHFEDARLVRVKREIHGRPRPARRLFRSADTGRFAIGAGFG